MPKPINHQADLCSLLERLNLALKAAKENLSHEAYLYELAKHEEEERTQRRTARLLRQAGLPQEKTWRTFDLERLSPTLRLQFERLKSGAFLQEVILPRICGVVKA